jgi:hypothetical protein
MHQISIVGITKRPFIVDISNDEQAFHDTTVLELKNKLVRENLMDSVEYIRLLFRGKQLDDSKTLGFYEIENMSTIAAVVRVVGGLEA